MIPTRIVAYCRAGFEPEAAADLGRAATIAGTELAIDAPTGRGYVVATPAVFDSQRWPRALVEAPPVFVRSLFFGTGQHMLFDAARTRGRPDRVAPLIELVDLFRRDCAIPGLPHSSRGRARFAVLRLETPDTNDGKAVSGLCRSIEAPFAQALRERGALADSSADDKRSDEPALHVLFADGATVYAGASLPPWGSHWAMGIPRIRMPREAPSRSTLKLAEAIVTFLGDREGELLHAGMRAVDLGAAPGGWTWQLAYRGLMVVAVDNGPLKGEVADDAHVTHIRVDGLTYLPRKPVDWMICDIVEQPSRIAALVGRWIAEGHARRCIFNLKLPMKKRYDEVLRCQSLIVGALARTRGKFDLQLRQLYHDREEVTGFVERIG
ncbi:MAG: 23S rRNA (cytidine(2498)-2'-O)-methyltransferase RlmM [Aromatoleum sp.]|nr:23S rRNA (cytidine(2498)-2'-O)-methyltransferase RlmM [Aromatoleum sp.]